MRLQPAVFLDRDGTLLEERSYLADPDAVVLVPGTVEALRELRALGFRLVTVTNQSGIARGLYTEADYRAVAARLNEILEQEGAPVDDTRYCPHHPEITGPCSCRKPSLGMYLEAADALGLDLRASYYVGDKLTDVVPALELGGQGILVRTGYGRQHEASVPEEVWVVDDLLGAVERIRSDGRSRRASLR